MTEIHDPVISVALHKAFRSADTDRFAEVLAGRMRRARRIGLARRFLITLALTALAALLVQFGLTLAQAATKALAGGMADASLIDLLPLLVIGAAAALGLRAALADLA